MRIQLSLLAAMLLAAPSATETDKSVESRIVCYYDTWAHGATGFDRFLAEDIPINLCTHAVYTFVDLYEKDWTITDLDIKFDIAEKEVERFIAMKMKNPQLKLFVAIGGAGGDKFSQMALKKERRDAFITSVVQFLNKYRLDGVDLYWHNPTRSDKRNFVLLVSELKNAFDKTGKGWKITMSVSIINLSFEECDELCSLVDAVHVLNYDLRRKWDVSVDVHSTLHKRPLDRRIDGKMNVNVGIKQWVDYGCSAHKLIVPFYGSTYNLRKEYKNYGLRTKTDKEAGGSNAGPYILTKGLPSYHEVDERWIDKWNDTGSHSFTYKDYNWVAYENDKSTRMKIDWLKMNGYGGAVLYFAGMDVFQGKYGEEYHLLKIIHKGMKDYKVPVRDLALTPRKLPSNPFIVKSAAVEEEKEAFDTSNEEVYGTINDDLRQSPSNKNPPPPLRPPCRSPPHKPPPPIRPPCRPPPHKPPPPIRPPCRPPPHKPPPPIRPPCRPPPHKPPPHYPAPPTRPPPVPQPTPPTAKPTTSPSTLPSTATTTIAPTTSTPPSTATTTTAPTTSTPPSTATTTIAPTTSTPPSTATTTIAPTTSTPPSTATTTIAPTTSTAPSTATTTIVPTTSTTTAVPTTPSTPQTTTQRPPQEEYPEPNCRNFPNDMYFAHKACDKFYQCTSKTSFNVIKCSTRTIWSQSALTCVHPAQADRIECRNWYDTKSNA